MSDYTAEDVLKLINEMMAGAHYKTTSGAKTITMLRHLAELMGELPTRDQIKDIVRAQQGPPFGTPENLAQEGFLKRWHERADKFGYAVADALIAAGVQVRG